MDEALGKQTGLAGAGTLWFDLPVAAEVGQRRIHPMTVEHFVDRWHNGADRTAANPKRPLPLHRIDPDRFYPVPELSELMDFSKHAVHGACRQGALAAGKDGRTWIVKGEDFIAWRLAVPAHTRFSIRDRLRNMHLRVLDESQGRITTAHIVDCRPAGSARVRRLDGNGWSLTVGMNQQILSDRGWIEARDAMPGTMLIAQRHGKHPDDRVDPNQLRKIDGRWRSIWQRDQRQLLIAEHGGCQQCGTTTDLQVHHVIPVHIDPDRTYDPDNVALLCQPCHRHQHRVQGWQTPMYLYGHPSIVTGVVDLGLAATYEIEVSPGTTNCLVDGIVVGTQTLSARAEPQAA